MGIETVSSIISAFVGGSLGIAALLRNWRSKTCVLFAVLCGLLLAHDLMAMVEEISGELATPKIHVLLTLAIAPVLLLFLREVISGFDRTLGKLAAAYIPVGVVAVLVLSFQSQPFVDRVLFLGSHAAFLLPAAAWIFLIARAEDQTTFTRERLRLRYLNWGVVFVLAFHITDVIHYSHLEKVPALGTLARTLYLFFVFQTVIQKELMTAEEVATKIALFGGVALVLSMIYTLLVSWVGDQQGLFFFNTFIASFVIIVLFDPIRKFTMRGVRHLFLHRNLVLERELEALSRELIGVVDPLDLAK